MVGGVARPAARAGTEPAEDRSTAAPIVGAAAALGEPATPVGETFQASVSVPADEVPPETGVAVLQEADEDEALGSTVDAIGSGPPHLVDVPVDEEQPLPGIELSSDASDDMETVTISTDDATDETPAAAEPTEAEE